MMNLYHYNARVISVYDGDTCTVDIDLGLGVWAKGEKIRLARINTPELRGDERPQGLQARDFLKQQIEGKDVILQTIKDRKGKYGRYLGEIWLMQEPDVWLNINDHMVQTGFAHYYLTHDLPAPVSPQ